MEGEGTLLCLFHTTKGLKGASETGCLGGFLIQNFTIHSLQCCSVLHNITNQSPQIEHSDNDNLMLLAVQSFSMKAIHSHNKSASEELVSDVCSRVKSNPMK